MNAKFFGWTSLILLIGIIAIILFVPKKIEQGKIKTFGRKNEHDHDHDEVITKEIKS